MLSYYDLNKSLEQKLSQIDREYNIKSLMTYKRVDEDSESDNQVLILMDAYLSGKIPKPLKEEILRRIKQTFNPL